MTDLAEITSAHSPAGLLRIYIKGVLHLAFSSDFAGLQSWKITRTRCPGMYFIEVTPKCGDAILTEYDQEYLWIGVLEEIDKAFGGSR